MNNIAAALGRSSSRWPPVTGREPLPAFPSITFEQPSGPYASCWAKEAYDSVLHGVPAVPDRIFHRGQVMSVIPGLTEGRSDSARWGRNDPRFNVSWDWTRYSDGQMRLAADFRSLICGDTHASISVPHAWNQHDRDEDRAVAALKRVMDYWHSLHPANVVSLNVASGEDETFKFTRRICDRLIELGALIPGRDIVCTCWQIDKWHTPVSGIEEIIEVGVWAHEHDLLNVVHWGGGYAGWMDNCAMWEGPTGNITSETYLRWGINDRHTFQQALGPSGLNVLDGHYGQCDVNADIGQVQSWIRKAVQAFTPGMFFVYAEGDMQAQSDNPWERLEVYGDLKAYLAQCTRAAIRISGSFNGQRGKTGGVLLPEGD